MRPAHWADADQTQTDGACGPDGSYRSDFTAGKRTGFLPGMQLEVRLDDGSEEFDREYRERFPGRAKRRCELEGSHATN